MLPKIGILYLTYPTPNWEIDIPRCLTSLEKLNYPFDRIELICIESKGKKPPVQPWFDTEWMPKSDKTLPRITYIFRDAWIGFAGNNNLGYEEAKRLGCDYVYLLNEDTDVDPDFLTRAVERAEADPKIAIVQSLLLLGHDRERLNSCGNDWHILGVGFSRGYHWTREQFVTYQAQERVQNPELAIAYASGAGELVRMLAIEDIGGLFDETFFLYHEDTDLSLRARVRGWKVVLEPSSIVYHYYEFAKAKMNYYWMERNRYALVWIYYRARTLFLLAPLFLVFEVALWFFSIKRGWVDMKWKVFKEWFDPAFWRWILRRRQAVKDGRRVNERDFLALSIAEIGFQEPSVKNPLLSRIGNPLMKWYWGWVRKTL